MSEEFKVRCEMMALWACQGKTIGRIRALQMRCFYALDQYRKWKKHSKRVLDNQRISFKTNQSRRVFQAWIKEFRVWKVGRDQEKFKLAVKNEIQGISASYVKEIE
jgi:hypothetical protein